MKFKHPKGGFTWDERYPKSYHYKRSKDIQQLREITEQTRKDLKKNRGLRSG